MRLSTRIRYAIRALVDLAANYNGQPVKINEIGKRQNLSLRYLENLFTSLKTANILKSQKGKNGGFYLNKSAKEITALDIFEAIEGKLSIIECIEDSDYCGKLSECPTYDLWDSLNATITKALQNVTLENLVQDYQKKLKKKNMYYI